MPQETGVRDNHLFTRSVATGLALSVSMPNVLSPSRIPLNAAEHGFAVDQLMRWNIAG